jgi:ribonuclease T2
MRLECLVTLLLPFPSYTKDTHFDILILTQHWPYTTCTDWEDRKPSNGCRKIDPASWSVHGLWPTQFGKIAPGYCNNTWKFDYDKIEPIRPKLDAYWPDFEIRDTPYSLWEHEWVKHGTCAAQLEPLNSELKYFGAGSDLSKQVPLTKWLAQNSITPGGTYNKMDMYNAVLQNTKVRPHIDCEEIDGQQFIKEIKVCFSKNLTLVHCDNIVGDLSGHHNSTGSCRDSTKVYYPSSTSKPTSTHLVWGLVFGLGGAIAVLALMVFIYVKTSRSRGGYEAI